ncbi:SAM-dependent methyltransferase [Amorphoplanes digitatis]|uniref:Methyltransferase domain-containing protein n=1 Tax=Actinoplanes digitatis TaxID=1868 RepID=A0A7W7HRT7_9ACTN|nr:hypothetical protein [Actinoplanes digitatis]MBB4759586.1 hypothetical protein [Actinoplanes digitatis]BFE67475.1 hypothetical protein GCM10020092_007760 [Actinoplanes digitatis]GID96920.1 hypothetical protein Adi01nite_63320 [Actinoplanes digitatis]
MDPPRHHTIREGDLRICNPFTPGKLATLGEAIKLRAGDTLLDLAGGRGEMLCTWARDHGISGTGVDISTVATDMARRLHRGDLDRRRRARHPPPTRAQPGPGRHSRTATRPRAELADDPLVYVRYRREYLGWGVFALLRTAGVAARS